MHAYQRAVAHVPSHNYLYAFCLFVPLRWQWIMMKVVIDSAHVMYLSALNMRSDWFFLVLTTFGRWFTAIHHQQESRAVAGKLHVRCRCKIRYISKFTAAMRHRSVLLQIARLSCYLFCKSLKCDSLEYRITVTFVAYAKCDTSNALATNYKINDHNKLGLLKSFRPTAHCFFFTFIDV